MKASIPFLLPALLSAAALHCATTPMQEFLVAQAPGYQALQPVTSADLRGFHLSDPKPMTFATNRCFRGELESEAHASFSEYTQSYSGGFAAGTEIARDFGGALGAGSVAVGAGRTFNGAITLGEVQEYRMRSVFFDSGSSCGQDAQILEALRRGDARFSVVTRALKAGSLRANSADGSHLNLELAVTEFGGKLERSSEDARSWRGVNLFFAVLPQEYRIAVKETVAEVGPNIETKPGDCGARLTAYDPIGKKWNGSINCGSGKNLAIRKQPIANWVGLNIEQGGVSYSLRYTPSRNKPGVFTAHLIRWTTIEAND
ncbi:MAG: hypothetical protein NXI24_15535 [bacterium]|nr:hypothetical protein [bacterium]